MVAEQRTVWAASALTTDTCPKAKSVAATAVQDQPITATDHGRIFEARKSLSNQTVVLVDDIATTGATARAAAHALKNAGARSVALVTITSA